MILLNHLIWLLIFTNFISPLDHFLYIMIALSLSLAFYFSTAVLAKGFELQYIFLLSLSTFFLNIVFLRLRKNLVSNLPLLSVFAVFVIGYYIKMYVMSYLFVYDQSGLFDAFFPKEVLLMDSSALILEYWLLIALCSFAFFLASYFLRPPKAIIISTVNSTASRSSFSKRNTKIRHSIFFMASFLLLILIKFLDVGNPYSPPLPFRLGGFLLLLANYCLPFLFIFKIFFQYSRSTFAEARLSSLLFILYGLIFSLQSTSKLPFLLSIFSVLILALLYQKLKIKGFPLFIILSIFLFAFPMFQLLLSSLRYLRAGDVANLFYQSEYIFEIIPLVLLAPFLRVGGSDSLLQILNYQGNISSFNILAVYSDPLKSSSYFYTEAVLGVRHLTGLTFSPGILGSLALSSSNNIFFVSLFFCLFLLLILIFSRLFFKYFSDSYLPLSICGSYFLAFVASEGNITSLPLFLLLLCCFGFCANTKSVASVLT